MNVADILRQAKTLSASERKELVKLLVDSLEVSDETAQYSILDFAGIAKHLADDEDPQQHINRLRDEWDNR
ncbi:MAG: hypothetical protein L0154_20280 [Chloroflexi bacterium]|nr:hypothetical protein [Chloroflexota bacterium]